MNSKLSVIFFCGALLLQGCLVKPPSDDSDLGSAVSPDTINMAMESAQSGIDPNNAYRLNDSGTVLTINTVLTNSAVQETDLYAVTGVSPTTVTVTKHVVETNQDYQGTIPKPTPEPSPTATPSAMYKVPQTPGLFDFVGKAIASFKAAALKWISKIHIQQSTAVADSALPSSLVPGAANVFSSSGPWTLNSERAVRGTPLDLNFAVSADTAQPSPSAAQSPVASPTPDNSGPTVVSDNYYRLTAFKHKLPTKNCQQITDCSVDATHIEFEEILVTSDGQTHRIHWSYEFSTVVPALFTMMDRCWSSIVYENGSQIPLKHCDSHLDDFRWGSN